MRKFLDIVTGTLAENAEAATRASGGTLKRYLGLLEEGYGDEVIAGLKVNDFVKGYVATMLWSSHDESTDAGGEPLDRNYSIEDIAPKAMERIVSDCKSFLHRAGPFIREERFKGARLDSTLEARAGHDFWLTRCGHGAGFWDGDWEGEDMNGPLTKIAKSYGNVDPYVGDDGKIHLM